MVRLSAHLSPYSAVVVPFFTHLRVLLCCCRLIVASGGELLQMVGFLCCVWSLRSLPLLRVLACSNESNTVLYSVFACVILYTLFSVVCFLLCIDHWCVHAGVRAPLLVGQSHSRPCTVRWRCVSLCAMLLTAHPVLHRWRW